jgi:hypothetical protein
MPRRRASAQSGLLPLWRDAVRQDSHQGVWALACSAISRHSEVVYGQAQ